MYAPPNSEAAECPEFVPTKKNKFSVADAIFYFCRRCSMANASVGAKRSTSTRTSCLPR